MVGGGDCAEHGDQLVAAGALPMPRLLLVVPLLVLVLPVLPVLVVVGCGGGGGAAAPCRTAVVDLVPVLLLLLKQAME